MHPIRTWRLTGRRHRSLFSATLLLAALTATTTSAATLTGRVTDPDGRTVAGAHVVVSSALGTAADRRTDENGAFDVAGLAEGRYDVLAWTDGLQADPVQVTLAGEESRALTIRLRLSAITESVVVSAAQVDVPLSRAAESVTVITGAELRARQIETVADALRGVPGLAVNRSGGRGALTSLFPRGGSSNYTLVLVDGMRANSFGGGYDLAHLAVADVDRIEVVRNPESALFGSDAIGAVVQIVTRRGGRPRADAFVEGGSQGTERAGVGAAGSRGAWSFGGGAEQTRSDGFTGLAPATAERVSNDDYHFAHASGSVGWQRPGGPDLLVAGNVEHDERGFPGPFGSNPIGAFGGLDRISRGVDDSRQVGARFAHSWTPGVRQRVDANYTDIRGEFTSPFGPSSSGTRRFDARVQEDVALVPSLGASAGVELVNERGSSTYVTGAADQPIPIDRQIVGAFAELRAALGPRLSAAGGLRVEHITRDTVEPNVSPFSSRPPFPAQSITSVNPKIAASYLLASSGTATTRVRASAGTGIRPPDVFEIAFTDNPNLKPEHSRSFDAGVEQQLAGGAYVLSATAFFNRYYDLIITVGRSLRDASHYVSDNISNAQAHGVELAAAARPTTAVTLHAAYTFLATEILSVDGLPGVAPPPFSVGEALVRRPRHQGSIEATYARRRITVFGALTTRSRVLDVEPNFGSFGGLFFTPGYAVVDLGGSVRLGHGLDLYGRVMNVADRRYEETLGFPALGRSGIMGVRVAAGR